MKLVLHVFLALVVSGWLGTAAPARAQMAYSALEDVVSVTLLKGWRDAKDVHYAGIKISLAPGWKTYWRAPGDGGLPTVMDWGQSNNLDHVEILWPRPQVFRVMGLRSVGYEEQVILPVMMKASAPGPIDFRLKLHFGICKEICIPVAQDLAGQLSELEQDQVFQIRAAMADRPALVETEVSCYLQESEGAFRLDVAARIAPLPGQAETSVIELADQSLWISEPFHSRDRGRVISQVRLMPGDEGDVPDLSGLRLTLLSTTSAAEIRGCDHMSEEPLSSAIASTRPDRSELRQHHQEPVQDH